MQEIAQVLETKQPVRGEVSYTGANGTLGTYDYIFTPVLGPDGEVESIVSSTRDITKRKRIEESLRQADQQKNAFLAQLAHELRNPLAPIRNAARIFRMKHSSEPEVLWASDVIDRQIDHLTRLIDDLLDISRISRNKLELRRPAHRAAGRGVGRGGDCPPGDRPEPPRPDGKGVRGTAVPAR